jgi:hypothetical protein
MRELHPIADLALQLLTPGLEERLALSDRAQAAIREALAAHFGAPTLRDAVRALVDLAHFMDRTERCPALASRILAIAEEALPALSGERRSAASASEEGRRRARRFLELKQSSGAMMPAQRGDPRRLALLAAAPRRA